MLWKIFHQGLKCEVSSRHCLDLWAPPLGCDNRNIPLGLCSEVLTGFLLKFKCLASLPCLFIKCVGFSRFLKYTTWYVSQLQVNSILWIGRVLSFTWGENVSFSSTVFLRYLSSVYMNSIFFVLWLKKEKLARAVNRYGKLLVVISWKLGRTGTFLSLYPESLSTGLAPSGHLTVIEKQGVEPWLPGAARWGNGEILVKRDHAEFVSDESF